MHNFDKSFKNHYCDALACGLGEFIDIFNNDIEDFLYLLSYEELENICEFSVLKNRLAGVGELLIKVPKPSLAIKSMQKYGVEGSEILSARLIESMKAGDLLGGRIILCVEDILDYNEGILAELSDTIARADIPIMIFLGQTLEEIGKIVNKFQKSPVEVLEDFGFLDRNCFIYGLNFIDKEDQKLLLNYDTNLILSPRSDAEEGKGAINLYNFIYNGLKFVFSSGKCYNIDMLGEGKLASLNTNNLMYERGLVKESDLNKAVFIDEKMPYIEEGNLRILYDDKFVLNQPELLQDYNILREKVRKIALKIKEKI